MSHFHPVIQTIEEETLLSCKQGRKVEGGKGKGFNLPICFNGTTFSHSANIYPYQLNGSVRRLIKGNY